MKHTRIIGAYTRPSGRQGFRTDTGEFVGPFAAATLVRVSGQCRVSNPKIGLTKDDLYGTSSVNVGESNQ